MRKIKFDFREKAFRLFAGLITTVTVCSAGCSLLPWKDSQNGEGSNENWETPAKTLTLADFSKEQALFENQLSTEGGAAWNLVENEGIYFDSPSAWNSKIIYTLQTPFVSEFSRERGNPRPHSITVTWKIVEPTNSVLTVNCETLQGDVYYVNLNDSNHCEIVQDGEYYASTFTWVDRTEGATVVDSLKAFIFRYNQKGATIIKSIKYEENKISLNEKDGEYVLADFNSSQYEKLLSLNDVKSGTTFDVVDSVLEIVTSPLVTWWDAAVNYRLLKAIPVSEMKELKFRSQVNFSVAVELVDEEGNGLKISNTDVGVTIGEQDDDGWYLYVVDMPTLLAGAFNNTLTAESEIVSLRMTSGSTSDVIYFDEFTYTKKA